jgi:hypothetical protein
VCPISAGADECASQHSVNGMAHSSFTHQSTRMKIIAKRIHTQ